MFDPDRPVRVFKNWKLGCWNVMQDGRLVASARQVRLAGVEFRVRESGRQRMLNSGRRNIHAYAVGRLVEHVHPDETRELPPLAGREVFYDGRRFTSFVERESGAAVAGAAIAQFDERGMFCVDVTSPPEQRAA